MVTFIHALVLTPYEATLPAQTIEDLLREDYPRHVIYNKQTGEEILSGFSYENSFSEQLAVADKIFDACKENVVVQFKKIVLAENQENEPR